MGWGVAINAENSGGDSDYCAVGNFVEVAEKGVGNFADHLQCNGGPKYSLIIMPVAKKC